MSSDEIQLIAVAILALTEMYAMRASTLSVFAWFWDILASCAGAIANYFGNLAVRARLNYFEAVQA